MKVALVNKHYQLGGIETVVHQLWHGLRGRGIGAELWISEFGELPAHESVRTPAAAFAPCKCDAALFPAS
jgi:hypothetical protein